MKNRVVTWVYQQLHSWTVRGRIRGHVDGLTIGIIELAAAQGSLNVSMFTPQQVKSSVCGHGGVDKAAVQKFASRLTGVSIKNAHAADSVAVAIAGHLRIH